MGHNLIRTHFKINRMYLSLFHQFPMILAAAFMSPAVIVLLLKIVLGLRRNRQSKIVAFFHPNCCDGGGGERVFWSFIDTFLNKIELDTDTTIVVYCGHTDKSRENIFDVVEVRTYLLSLILRQYFKSIFSYVGSI